MPQVSAAFPGLTIQRWTEVPERDRERLLAALDDIFFEASLTKTFATDKDRAAFRERWLGRYLAHDAQWAYLALDADGTLAGYLVGSIDDPARSARFADIGYFRELSHLTPAYPAQLHINLAPQYRNRGIGAALIERFAADATRAGVPGLHVVTGAQSRNVGFYERCGLRELARIDSYGSDIVFLARPLAAPETA